MEYVKQRPFLADSEHIRILLGDMSSWLAVTRSALYASAKMWEEASRCDWDSTVINDAELLGLEALHVSKQVALDVTRRVYDICGARSAFRSFPLEAMDRDVRTFTLHFRDDLYTLRIADAILGGQRLSKDRYAAIEPGVARSASTIPQA
jgi:alkylation response protein AidB-like acyl-CoA dehydrogenase